VKRYFHLGLLGIGIGLILAGALTGCGAIATPTPFPTPTKTLRPTFTATPSRTPTPAFTKAPTQTGPANTPTPQPTKPATPTPVPYYVAAGGSGVYIRSEPNREARVKVWEDGTVMLVLEQAPAGWMKVKAPDGYVGYVPAEYLARTPVPTPVPPPPPPTNTPVPLPTRPSYAYRIANIEARPNCGTTYIKGTVYGADGSRRDGIKVRLWAGSEIVATETTNKSGVEPGLYTFILQQGGPRAGQWRVAIISDDGTILSEVANVETTQSPCKPETSGKQEIILDFQALQ